MVRQGRPPKFSDEHRALLARIVEANPLASMDELRAAVERSTGIKVHGQTLEKHLLAAGIERRRDTTVVQAQKTVETKTRYVNLPTISGHVVKRFLPPRILPG